MNTQSSKFNRGELIKLFLIVAFPLHVWTILMTLRDVGWVAEGRTLSGAVGFSAYVLSYTLVESLVLFGGILLLGLLISKNWSTDQRLVSLGLVATVLASWSIIEQIILVLLHEQMTRAFSSFALLGASPWLGMALLGLLVTFSFALPVFLALRSEKFSSAMLSIFDRLSLLSGMYLFFDFAAIIILIVRNV
ncbi:MAG: hypothetical protein ABFS17_06890 [Chloroflexota bacterium]